MQEDKKYPLRPGGYIEYIDVLRVLSMLAVVFLHTAAGSLRGNIGSPIWHVSNVFTGVMGTSVPIFFMISGAMLLSSPKTLSIRETYRKRLPKALIPLISWSLAAVGYLFIMGYIGSGKLDWHSAAERIKNILNTPTTTHLWFMYVLIPLYILSPLLKKLVDALDAGLVKYMLLIWLTFSFILPTIAVLVPVRFRPLFTLNASYNLNAMNGYLGYFIFGYYLSAFNRKVSKKLLTGVIVFDLLLISLGTWFMTVQSGKYDETFKSYNKLFTLVLSVAIFMLVKELLSEKNLSARLSAAVKWLSAASFGVYLLHNLVVDLIAHRIHLYPATSFLSLFGCYFIALISSLAFITIAASIKFSCFALTGHSYKQACESLNLQFLFRRFFAARRSAKIACAVTKDRE